MSFDEFTSASRDQVKADLVGAPVFGSGLPSTNALLPAAAAPELEVNLAKQPPAGTTVRPLLDRVWLSRQADSPCGTHPHTLHYFRVEPGKRRAHAHAPHREEFHCHQD